MLGHDKRHRSPDAPIRRGPSQRKVNHRMPNNKLEAIQRRSIGVRRRSALAEASQINEERVPGTLV
jgi:hypothetical protein